MTDLTTTETVRASLKTNMGREALLESLSCIQLFDRKQQDYGSRNIASFDNKTLNMLATAIRLNDKVQRLLNLLQKQLKTPEATPNNESIRDNARDVSNYGLILALLEQDKWL